MADPSMRLGLQHFNDDYSAKKNAIIVFPKNLCN